MHLRPFAIPAFLLTALLHLAPALAAQQAGSPANTPGMNSPPQDILDGPPPPITSAIAASALPAFLAHPPADPSTAHNSLRFDPAANTIILATLELGTGRILSEHSFPASPDAPAWQTAFDAWLARQEELAAPAGPGPEDILGPLPPPLSTAIHPDALDDFLAHARATALDTYSTSRFDRATDTIVVGVVDPGTEEVIEERSFPASEAAGAWEAAEKDWDRRQMEWLEGRTREEIEPIFEWPHGLTEEQMQADVRETLAKRDEL